MNYSRHQPEKTDLYKTLEKELLTYRSQSTIEWPNFVKKEVHDFLNCGLLSRGFIRVSCSECKNENLVAFSCKRRGFCPSCCAKRMNTVAAHLVENVFPRVRVRQWVLSFPLTARVQMAYEPKTLNKALKIFIRVVSKYYQKKSKTKKSKVAAVTAIQRFGGALNLNIHFHTLFVDGVYNENNFLAISAPTQDEILDLCEEIYNKTKALFNGDDEIETGLVSTLALSPPKLTQLLGDPENEKEVKTTGGYCGFSLNAGVSVSSYKRDKLEKLCRYILRGPVSTQRLTKLRNGMLIYKFKQPWSNGATHIKMTPNEFIEKLHALVPPPRRNLIRYHGLFAANAKNRKYIVGVDKSSKRETKRQNLSWAEMLKRVFGIDVSNCQICDGKTRVISCVKDPKIIKKILDHVKEEIYEPTLSPATPRGPPIKSSIYATSEVENQVPPGW